MSGFKPEEQWKRSVRSDARVATEGECVDGVGRFAQKHIALEASREPSCIKTANFLKEL